VSYSSETWNETYKQTEDYRMSWDDVRGMDQTFSVQRHKNLQTTSPNVLERARAHHRSTCEVVYRSGFLYTHINHHTPAFLNLVNVQSFKILAHDGAERAQEFYYFLDRELGREA
jgi:hypothetical protein